MATEQQFCLRWNNHQSTLISVFDALLENSVLVDCTLAADGQQLKAHKVVLSACSPYLETILSQHYDKHPIIILKDVKFPELKAMLDYMYHGEVNISQEQLGTFLKAAEALQIKGLTDSGGGGDPPTSNKQPEISRKSNALLNNQQTTVPPPATIRTRSVNNSSAFAGEDRKPQNLVIPPHVLDKQPVSPSLNREGSISPTVRKRKRLNSLSQSDNLKLVHQLTSNDNIKTNSTILSFEQTSQNSLTSNIAPSSPGILPIIKSEPDTMLPTTIDKTDGSEHCISNDKSSMEDHNMMEDENNENVCRDDDTTNNSNVTNNANSPGPSRHFISQGYPDKTSLTGGDSSSDIILQASDDLQTGNQDSGIHLNPYIQQRKLVPNLYSVKVDSQIQSFPCQACGKVYNRKGNLGRHIRYECGKGPQFPCHLCEKRFFRREKLALHVKNHEIFQQNAVPLLRGQGRVSI